VLVGGVEVVPGQPEAHEGAGTPVISTRGATIGMEPPMAIAMAAFRALLQGAHPAWMKGFWRSARKGRPGRTSWNVIFAHAPGELADVPLEELVDLLRSWFLDEAHADLGLAQAPVTS